MTSPDGVGLTCGLRSPQVHLEHGGPDVAQEPFVVHEPAHEAVSVHAVEQDALAVLCRFRPPAARLQQRQVAERHPAARAPTSLRGAHARAGQQRCPRLHRGLRVQHEVLRSGPEGSAARRVLRSGEARDDDEEEEGGNGGGGGGGWRHFVEKIKHEPISVT